jgi:uncharacterized protein YndB with AHSA1/START domain
MKRIEFYILLVLVLLFSAMIVFSPYGSQSSLPYKAISHTVDIDAPVSMVFAYLGNSANASNWSVFVDHIVPLNTDSVNDGTPGSIRRCFTDSAEKEMKWDELITEVVPNKKRQLTIYNMIDFPMSAKGLATEQLYQTINDSTTRLTFTVFFQNDPTLWDQVKMYIGAYRIKPIFRNNMGNIKKILEGQ